MSLFWGRGTEEAFDVQEMVPSCLVKHGAAVLILRPCLLALSFWRLCSPAQDTGACPEPHTETSSGYISVLMFMYHIYPQQHGHFQWPDFEDNSSFFISGVFSSVLILDTFFFFASHLLIPYLGTSFFMCVFHILHFISNCFHLSAFFLFCGICMCNTLSSLNFILIYELVLYRPIFGLRFLSLALKSSYSSS